MPDRTCRFPASSTDDTADDSGSDSDLNDDEEELDHKRRINAILKPGCVYWVDSLSDLRYAPAETFDAVISFGMTNTGSKGVYPLLQTVTSVNSGTLW